MFELSFSEDFTKLERALMTLAGEQMPFAAAQAVNDCARAASVAVNRAMADVFDRPTRFTERAAIAPRALAATKDRLQATVTLRPTQAAYLRLEEQGGTRSPDDNTRKPAKAIVLPGKALDLNAYGNIPNAALRALRAAAKQNALARAKRRAKTKQPDSGESVVFLKAGVPGNKAGIGGYFRRLPGHHLARLTAFEAETRYKARMGYHDRVGAAVAATWVDAMTRRLAAAIASAR